MEELIQKVIQWANDRNIIQGSSAIKQLDKTSEEFNELQRALAQWYLVGHLNVERGFHNYDLEADTEKEVRDAYGDILVTLIIAAAMDEIDLEDCLAQAWDTIKDRKGRLVNGLFVKETE